MSDVERVICDAITARRLLRLDYAGTSSPGVRVVEPHAVGTTPGGSVVLQAWFLEGDSASAEGPGWRTYLLEHMTEAAALDNTFAGPRPGYRPNGGKSFRSVRCAL